MIDDDWEDRISQILKFAEDTIGLVVPLNVTVLDQRNSSPETLNQVNVDGCSLRVDANSEQLNDCVNILTTGATDSHQEEWMIARYPIVATWRYSPTIGKGTSQMRGREIEQQNFST